MIEHIVLAALVLYALYRIEHHGYHTKRVLMAIRDIMKHDHSYPPASVSFSNSHE